MRTCANCEFFKLSNGAYYVGDCLADINRISTLNSKAEFCIHFKEIKKDGRKKEN